LDLETVARIWIRSHRQIRILARPALGIDYLCLRYEDLCRDPESKMREVFEFLGVQDENVCTRPLWKEKHHLIGNKMLYTFDGSIRLDESWRERLSSEEQTEVLRLTEPLSGTYDYGPSGRV
jgi:hypothetical protein